MQYRKKPVVIDAFKYEGDLKNSDGSYCVPEWRRPLLNLESCIMATNSKTWMMQNWDCSLTL